MLVYNQKYRVLLSASLHGVMIERMDNRLDHFHGSSPWNWTNFFYLRLRQMEETLSQL